MRTCTDCQGDISKLDKQAIRCPSCWKVHRREGKRIQQQRYRAAKRPEKLPFRDRAGEIAEEAVQVYQVTKRFPVEELARRYEIPQEEIEARL